MYPFSCQNPSFCNGEVELLNLGDKIFGASLLLFQKMIHVN